MLRERERHDFERAEHLDARRVEAGLFTSLSERRRDGPIVAGIDAPTGERDLPGVRPQGRRTREQQHIEVARHGVRAGRRGRSAASRARRTGSARPRAGVLRPRAGSRATPNTARVATPWPRRARARAAPVRRARWDRRALFRLRPSHDNGHPQSVEQTDAVPLDEFARGLQRRLDLVGRDCRSATVRSAASASRSSNTKHSPVKWSPPTCSK